MHIVTEFTETTRTDWEQFVHAQAHPQFLQSSHMAEMHAGLNEHVTPVFLYDGEQLVGGCLAIFVEARRGKYLYVQYGPLFGEGQWQHFDTLTAELRQLGKKLGADFIRVCPFIADSTENQQLFRAAGFRRAPIHMLAEHIWWLDITPDEDDIFAGMRKTMRNLIRRAGRDGVTIEQSTDPVAVEDFIAVHKDTFKRHNFVPYPDDYFRQQFAAFAPHGEAVMFLARYEGQVIAASMIMFYGNMASYHHGASLSEFNKVPATYLLQWEAIQEAKRRGCTKYNFWGIAPDGHHYSKLRKTPHPFLGVTKFKQGFGGELFNLLPCQDLPLTPKYQLTRAIETFRKYKRGFF